jgi:pyruvate carboxylase
MERALRELRIHGVRTSVPFHLAVMGEADFREGRLDILYLEKHQDLLLTANPVGDEGRVIALAAALLEEESRVRTPVAGTSAVGAARPSAWKRPTGWNGR